MENVPEKPLVAAEPPPAPPPNASVGAILSIIIILAMIIIGAFYTWGERISAQRAAQSANQPNSALTTQ